MTISSIRCQVWWARPAVETPRLLDLLDPIERTRYTAYHRTIDQLRFLTGRVVSKALAAEALAIEPAQVTLDSTCPDCGRPHGKPRVIPPSNFSGVLPELSISHSGNLVGVAMTPGQPVGLDVEQERDVEIDGLVRMTLSAAEQTEFAAVPATDRDAAFFTYWSRKEAILKATGRGLAIGMTKLTVSPWDQPPRVLDSQASEVDTTTMRMTQLDAGSGYRACVAVIAKDEVAVTAGLPVGIDVEQERDVEVDGLVRMTRSPAEQIAWSAVPAPDRDAAFFTYWSRKEAILKATGRGLSIAMTKVTVTPWDQPPRVLESQASEVDGSRLRMAQLDAGSGYRACVAVIADASTDLSVTIHDADPIIAGLS